MSATTRSSTGDTSGAVVALGKSLASPPIHGSTRNLSLMVFSRHGGGDDIGTSQQRSRGVLRAAAADRKARLRGTALLQGDRSEASTRLALPLPFRTGHRS